MREKHTDFGFSGTIMATSTASCSTLPPSEIENIVGKAQKGHAADGEKPANELDKLGKRVKWRDDDGHGYACRP